MTMYSALLEYARDVDEREAANLLEHLQQYHASVSRTPAGRLSIRLTFPAESARQALSTAVAIGDAGTISGQPLAAVELGLIEVMTEEEFDARQGFEHMPELVTTEIAGEILGVSQQRASQMVAEGKFVSAQRAGKRTTVIARSEVERLAARTRAAAPAPK